MALLLTLLVGLAASVRSLRVPDGPGLSRGSTRAQLLRALGGGALGCAAVLPASAIPPLEALTLPDGSTTLGVAPPPAVLYTPPAVKGESTPDAIALAKHLSATGAKMYGAYWCRYRAGARVPRLRVMGGAGRAGRRERRRAPPVASTVRPKRALTPARCRPPPLSSHCNNQKQAFGAGGVRQLAYIECAADGYKSQRELCRSKPEVTGYPTWEIGGKYFGGEKSLDELAALSGYKGGREFGAVAPVAAAPPPQNVKPPAVRTESTSAALALARHLRSKGDRMYGAYWCSHCFNQRSMFGAAAAASLDYVECAAGGADAQPKVCATKQIEGYPTWEIGGKFYSGERSLAELAQLSGYEGGGFE